VAPRDTDTIEMLVPCQSKFLSVLRLAVAGAAARAGLGVGEVDDVKVAVSEACTNVIDHAFPPEQAEAERAIHLRIIVREGELRLEVEDEGVGFDPKRLPKPDLEERVEQEGGLGLYLIHGLMDDVKVESAPGSGTKITMIKRPAR
jgi:serine/threonine-protein kinase RsbW